MDHSPSGLAVAEIAMFFVDTGAQLSTIAWHVHQLPGMKSWGIAAADRLCDQVKEQYGGEPGKSAARIAALLAAVTNPAERRLVHRLVTYCADEKPKQAHRALLDGLRPQLGIGADELAAIDKEVHAAERPVRPVLPDAAALAGPRSGARRICTRAARSVSVAHVPIAESGPLCFHVNAINSVAVAQVVAGRIAILGGDGAPCAAAPFRVELGPNRFTVVDVVVPWDGPWADYRLLLDPAPAGLPAGHPVEFSSTDWRGLSVHIMRKGATQDFDVTTSGQYIERPMLLRALVRAYQDGQPVLERPLEVKQKPGKAGRAKTTIDGGDGNYDVSITGLA